MRPIDFVVYGGDGQGIPPYDLTDALMRPIKINGPDSEYEIISYYISEGKMILAIQRKD